MANRSGRGIDHPDFHEMGRLFFDHSPTGIFRASKEGVLLEVNQRLSDLLGYSPTEMQGLLVIDLILQQDNAQLPPLLQQWPGNSKQPQRCRLRVKKGDMLTVDLQVHVMKDGSLLGLVEEGKKHDPIEQQTHEYAEHFRILAESSLAGIYLIQDNRYGYVNQAFAEMFGYEVQEILTKTEPLDIIHPEDLPLVAGNLGRRIKGEVDSIRYGFRCLHKNGSTIYVEVHGRRIEYGGKPAVIGTLIDISSAKRAEEELQGINEELEARVEERTRALKESYRELKLAHASLLQQEKMASIGQLAAGVAHEINTPIQFVGDNIAFIQESLDDLLAGMKSCQSLAQSKSETSTLDGIQKGIKAILADADFDYLREEIPEAFRATVEGIRHISSIVAALKEFSHPSGDTFQQVDLEKLIGTTVKISSNVWKAKAKLTVEHGDTPLVVEGLKDELGQVLLNLISNAADAIEEAQPGKPDVGNILIQTRSAEENWAEIVVRDSGSGMSPERQQRIFEPFFTTKEVGRGSGQGLAIAYGIVKEKHGGEILVDSTPGKGSTFTVRLPISRGQ